MVWSHLVANVKEADRRRAKGYHHFTIIPGNQQSVSVLILIHLPALFPHYDLIEFTCAPHFLFKQHLRHLESARLFVST